MHGQNRRVDVVVVGGGIAGSSMATVLAGHGLQVAVPFTLLTRYVKLSSPL